jgi:heme exporter protein CcmD
VTHAVYVFSGYAATTALLGAYAAWIISRRRAVARSLPPVTDEGAPPGQS